MRRKIAEPFVVPFAPVDYLAFGVDDRNEMGATRDRIFGWAIADLGVAVVPEDGLSVAKDGIGFVASSVAQREIGRMCDLRMRGPADNAAENVDDRNGAGRLGPFADRVRINGWLDEWMNG